MTIAVKYNGAEPNSFCSVTFAVNLTLFVKPELISILPITEDAITSFQGYKHINLKTLQKTEKILKLQLPQS